MLVTSGNISERGRKEASVLDWDFYGLLQSLTTGELSDKAETKKKNEAQKQFNNIADTIQALAIKDDKDGKE